MGIPLHAGHKWTPTKPSEYRLSRTVVSVKAFADGEVVTYWIDGGDGEMRDCRGPTFRDWISKMRASSEVDEFWSDLLSTNEKGDL